MVVCRQGGEEGFFLFFRAAGSGVGRGCGGRSK